jgi:hypothetical protein
MFNDKHLLWWIMCLIREFGSDFHYDHLLDENAWNTVGAPDWVLPSIREKHEIMKSQLVEDK